MKRWNKDEEDKLISLWIDKSLSYKDIILKMEKSRGSINSKINGLAKKYDLPSRKGRGLRRGGKSLSWWTKENKEVLKNLWNNGVPIYEIKNHIILNNKHPTEKAILARICLMRKEGYALIYGNSRTRGGRRIKKGYSITEHGYKNICISSLNYEEQSVAKEMIKNKPKGHNYYIQEHRIVIAIKIGRPLTNDEIVHHLNGNRLDNRPENLVITTKNKHEHGTLIKELQKRIGELENRLNSKPYKENQT